MASKAIKKIASIALPIAGAYFGGPLLAGALGTSAATGAAIGGGLGGAAGGAVSGGGLKGALLGGATGAAGGYFANGGLGTLPSNSLASGVAGPSSPGTGVIGSLSRNGFGTAATKLSGALAGGGSSAYSPLTSIASGVIGTGANDDAAKKLLEQQQRNRALYSPILNDSFNPGDLTQDPGYQFQLKQGQTALDRQQSAKGNYFSGEALKSAQDYGQGLADTTYNEAYQRWLQGNQQKLGTVGAIAGINDNIGNIGANQTINNGNVLTQSIAGLTGGQAANNTGALMGGDSSLATLLQGLTPEQIASLKARNPSMFAGA